ncbi:MAG: hypothetical protein U0T83_06770 [Bacteriovoracaceae bacterium]
MKKLFFAMFFIMTSLFAEASDSKNLFHGEWEYPLSGIISVITTKDYKTWESVSCLRKEYLTTKTCIKPDSDSVPTYYVYNERVDGLCSIKTDSDSFCWQLIRVYENSEGRDTLIMKADPFNSEPGLGYALSAYRLSRK